jgi:hypothetical protein
LAEARKENGRVLNILDIPLDGVSNLVDPEGFMSVIHYIIFNHQLISVQAFKHKWCSIYCHKGHVRLSVAWG